MKKIKILSLLVALFAFSLLLINKTIATNVTLDITAWSLTCTYTAGAIDVWDVVASGVGQDLFSSPATWFCDDLQWTASWDLTVQASDLVWWAFTISGSNIFMQSDAPTLSGTASCTPSAGTTSYTAIDSAQPLIWKTSASGETCSIKATNILFKVTIPGWSPVAAYSSTLTLSI